VAQKCRDRLQRRPMVVQMTGGIRNAASYYFDGSVGTIKQMRPSAVPDRIIEAMVRRGERGGL
jgi:hypothetical protein